MKKLILTFLSLFATSLLLTSCVQSTGNNEREEESSSRYELVSSEDSSAETSSNISSEESNKVSSETLSSTVQEISSTAPANPKKPQAQNTGSQTVDKANNEITIPFGSKGSVVPLLSGYDVSMLSFRAVWGNGETKVATISKDGTITTLEVAVVEYLVIDKKGTEIKIIKIRVVNDGSTKKPIEQPAWWTPTEAQIKTIVENTINYGIEKGIALDNSLTIENAGWNAPTITNSNTFEKASIDSLGRIDFLLNEHYSKPQKFNVVSQAVEKGQYKIYVLYW